MLHNGTILMMSEPFSDDFALVNVLALGPWPSSILSMSPSSCIL